MKVLRIKRGATGVLDVLIYVVIYVVYHLSHKGQSTKDVRQIGRAVVLKFRTFPERGGGG